MKTILRDGRTWNVDSSGINTLRRKYTLILDSNNLSANGEIQDFSIYGIPAIGSVHPVYSDLSVQSYDVEEGTESEKKLVNVTANYSNKISQDEESGEGISATSYVEQWGWDGATDQKELQTNLLTAQYASEGGQILNSAGDPFDSAIVCDFPAPVFTKVMKTTARRDWLQYNCKLNQNTCEIGSMSCAAKTLIASVSEERIFGEKKWKYRYVIKLQYKSNFANYGSGTTPIEYGWDIPVVDAGIRELNKDGKPVVITKIDQESKMPTAVTTPELLDGSGHKVDRTSGRQV